MVLGNITVDARLTTKPIKMELRNVDSDQTRKNSRLSFVPRFSASANNTRDAMTK